MSYPWWGIIPRYAERPIRVTPRSHPSPHSPLEQAADTARGQHVASARRWSGDYTGLGPPKHLVVRTCALHNLNRDIFTCAGMFDLLVIDFHGEDPLRKIRRMTQDMDLVAHLQFSLIDVNDGNARTLEVVRDRPDELFRHVTSQRVASNAQSQINSAPHYARILLSKLDFLHRIAWG